MKNRLRLIVLILCDIILVGLSFLVVAWFKSGTVHYVLPKYSPLLLFFMVFWVIISIISGKYVNVRSMRLQTSLFNILYTDFIILGGLAIVLQITQQTHSRLIVFGTIGVSFVLEILSVALIHATIGFRSMDEDHGLITKSKILEEVSDSWEPMDERELEGKYRPAFVDFNEAHALNQDRIKKFFSQDAELYDFIADVVDMRCFSQHSTYVLKTDNYFNVEFIENGSLELFVNLENVNHFKRLNRYFIRVNENLTQGGVFVGCAQTVEQRYRSFIKRYTRFWGNLFYFIDFIYRRIFPKVKLFQSLYFFLTNGRDRALSLTEILGRLFFCGFTILAYKEIDNTLYFIAKKIKEPSSDPNPSYGILVKMRRSGKNGKPIYIYKFRTMHPYSEYLQGYLATKHGYGDSHKVARDFRITSWGRVLRKLWLDELPQLINFFRGELRLVGIRPFTEVFLRNFPDDLREARKQMKPGCIPNYISFGASNITDIIESERQYIAEWNKNPLLADLKIFFGFFFRVLFRKAKST